MLTVGQRVEFEPAEREAGLPAAEETYAFDNARRGQLERLRALEAVLDAGSKRHLESLGIERGCRCLEVGAGGGSIAAWLCDRVGPNGSVLATDLDTTALERLSHPNLEVRVHDVVQDELPEREFDVVHLRLLLAWLSDPGTALRRLAGALKPGGLLVAEEMDFVSVAPDPRVEPDARSKFARAVAAHNSVLSTENRFDPDYGRRLAGDLVEAGLTGVGAEGRVSMWRGGQAGGTVWRLTFLQLREGLVTSGLVSPSDIDEVIMLCEDPTFAFLSQVVMGAWGRRPPRD